MLSKEEICHDLGTEADLKACWLLRGASTNHAELDTTICHSSLPGRQCEGGRVGGHRQCKDKLQGFPAGVCSLGVSYN